MIRLPCFDPTLCLQFGNSFRWENNKIWTRVLHRSCSCICKIDVRLLNHLNRTSTAQVMVHFSRLPQLRLFICLCPNFDDFETVLRTDFKNVQTKKFGLSRTGLAE